MNTTEAMLPMNSKQPNKDTDNSSAAMVTAANTTVVAAQGKGKQTFTQTMKPTFNPQKTVGPGTKMTTGPNPTITPIPKDFPMQSRCCLHWWHMGGKEMAKQTYCTFLVDFLNQAATIDMTIMIFKFFTADCAPPKIPTPLISKPFALLADLGNLRHYFPRRVSNPPANTSVMVYTGHTVAFQTLVVGLAEWLTTRNASLTLTLIQSEHAINICWLVYSTKNTNCQELGTTLSTLLGYTVRLQFKAINTRLPYKPQASAVHILADTNDTLPIMKTLNEIYSVDQMKNRASEYPLGQRLLLAPMAKGLNDQNLMALLQLKVKQTSFCSQVVMVTTWAIAHLNLKANFTADDRTHEWSL